MIPEMHSSLVSPQVFLMSPFYLQDSPAANVMERTVTMILLEEPQLS